MECEKCIGGVKIASLKVIMDKCKTLYYTCKSCSEGFHELAQCSKSDSIDKPVTSDKTEKGTLIAKVKAVEEENEKLETRLKSQALLIGSLRKKCPSDNDKKKTVKFAPEVDDKHLKAIEKKLNETEVLLELKTIEVMEQQQKFEDFGNPEFDKFNALEGTMKKQLGKIESNLKESLLQEVRANNQRMDEKLNKLISRKQWSEEPRNPDCGDTEDSQDKNEINRPEE